LFVLKPQIYLSMEELLAQNHFTPEEIQEFISNALIIKCSKRTVLLREGETPRFFYWATKGVFRAGFTDKKGNEHTRHFFSPNTLAYVVNYGSFALQRPSLSFIDTVEDGELFSWHFDYMKKLQDTNIKWLKFFKKTLDILFCTFEEKELRTYTFTPEERYLAFLDISSDFAHRIPQHYIASYVGISPEALSRIRGRINPKKQAKICKNT
jgi:CRP-like cAMP-binding protein